MKIFASVLLSVLLPLSALTASARESSFPVPDTVSPELRAMISRGIADNWTSCPENNAGWKAWASAMAEKQCAVLPALREKLGVTSTPAVMAGVPVFLIRPRNLHDDGRILLHLHGGGYVLGQGEAGTQEAVLMAGIGKFNIISVDYRMAPDFPYPAALRTA